MTLGPGLLPPGMPTLGPGQFSALWSALCPAGYLAAPGSLPLDASSTGTRPSCDNQKRPPALPNVRSIADPTGEQLSYTTGVSRD